MASLLSAVSGCDSFICCIGCLSLVPGLVRRVVNQVAFFPPRPPGYHVTEEKQVFLVEADYDLTPLPDLASEGIAVDTVRMWTERGNVIMGFHFRRADSTKTLLFSHGNSTDIGIMFHHLRDLCSKLQVDVFAYEYSGYGESSGIPSEADLYADVEAAYHYLTHDCSIPDNQIVCYGQSIGSVPSIDLASRTRVGGVVLHSAMKSGLGVIHDVKTTYWFDVFQNAARMKTVTAPVFVIHGTHDTEIPFEHGVTLFEACPAEMAYDPWWVKEAGHNDIEINHRAMYFEHLARFLKALDSHERSWRRSSPDQDNDNENEQGSENGWQPLLGGSAVHNASYSYAQRSRPSLPMIECYFCLAQEDVHVNESWAGSLHSACNHAVCSSCLRPWIRQSLGSCAARGELRVPCFQSDCPKVLPQTLVLTVSKRARNLAKAIDAEQGQPLGFSCQSCGRLGLTPANDPCGHAACADCLMEWCRQELPRCRAECRRAFKCFSPNCRCALSRALPARLKLESLIALCSEFWQRVDTSLEEMAGLEAVVLLQTKPVEPGPVCPICHDQQLALISAQTQCAQHLACLSCWTSWARQQLDRCIERRRPAVRCLHPKCPEQLDASVWAIVCTRDSELQALEQRFVRRRRLQQNPFYPAELQVDCPQPGCLGLGYLGHDRIMCFVCEHQWVPDDGAGAVPETDVEVVMGVAVKKCPSCNEYIEKNGGCDHMTCRCRHEFWWSSLKPYRK